MFAARPFFFFFFFSRAGYAPARRRAPARCHPQPHVELAEGSPPLALPVPTEAALREAFALPNVDDGGRLLLPPRAQGGADAGAVNAVARGAVADTELEALEPQVRAPRAPHPSPVSLRARRVAALRSSCRLRRRIPPCCRLPRTLRAPYFPSGTFGSQIVPAGTRVLAHDDLVLAAREVEKLERRKAAVQSARHARLRDAIAELNRTIVNPRLKLSLM